MRNLNDFVKDILIYKGAIVEEMDNQMEILAPVDLAETLQIPENANLIFSPKENSKHIFLSYDSDVFKNIIKLFNNDGRFCTINIPAQSIKIDKMENKLNNQIILNNAVFKLVKKEEIPISYILSFFKYMAISDETQEGITASLLNEFNLSTSYFNIEDLFFLTNNLQEPLDNVRRE
ncbi:hypothetical protein HY745_14140, partial [Candidatus Desantisbacteria bacterium]|nr:hypothetical protein [Candidatus Desantisbacteria bacterium]